MTFTDLQHGQLCTFIHTQDFGLQDVLIGIRNNSALIPVISMNNNVLSGPIDIDSEFLRRTCSFVSAGEILSIDPADYPEIVL